MPDSALASALASDNLRHPQSAPAVGTKHLPWAHTHRPTRGTTHSGQAQCQRTDRTGETRCTRRWAAASVRESVAELVRVLAKALVVVMVEVLVVVLVVVMVEVLEWVFAVDEELDLVRQLHKSVGRY